MAVKGTKSVKNNVLSKTNSKFDFVASGQLHILIYFSECSLLVLSFLSRMQLTIKF